MVKKLAKKKPATKKTTTKKTTTKKTKRGTIQPPKARRFERRYEDRAFQKIEDDYQNGLGVTLIEFLRMETGYHGETLEKGKGDPITLADVRSDLEDILGDLDQCENDHGAECPLKDLA